MLTRRTLAALPLLLASQAGAQPASTPAASTPRFDGETLRIGTFGGTNAEAIRAAVEPRIAAAGAKLEFVTGSPQDNMAKVIASLRGRGEPAMDAFEVLGAMVPQVAALNLLAPLDYALLPNAAALSAQQRQPSLVAIWTTQEMIIANVAKLAEAGIAPPTSLKNLADPRLAGRVMIPDVSSGGGLEAVGAFALTAGGSEADIDPGLRLIRSIPGLRLWKAGGEVVTAFKSGDIWVAVAHAGWAVRTEYAGVKVTATPARLGDGHEGIIKEGFMGIVHTSRKAALASLYIDAYLSAATQREMTVKTGTVPVSPQALAGLADVPVVRDLMVLDPARVARMARIDFSRVDIADWNDRWNRVVAR